MQKKRTALLLIVICNSYAVSAQVQVSKEPLHKLSLENKYIRLLDVNIEPGDTTMFHIHSTPSVFVHYTTTMVCTQIKGQEWESGKNTIGNASYRSFENDTLVHRVSNCDTVPFHVTDVELLSAYKPEQKLEPLPFPLLFENERVVAYRLMAGELNGEIIKDRGPMVAQMVAGRQVIIHNEKGKELSRLKSGEYFYIDPGAAFYFSADGDAGINMVLFEIK